MDTATKENQFFTKTQLGGLIGLAIWLSLILIFPSKILTMAFLLGIMIYSILFPTKSFLFLIAYFPARSFFIETNPYLKILAEVILISTLLHVAFKGAKNPKSLFHFHWFELAFFAFCATGSISAFLNGVGISAIVTELRAFLLTYIAFYVFKRLKVEKSDMSIYLWTTFLTAFVLSLLGIIEKVTDKTFLFPSQWEFFAADGTNGDRVYGLTKNPNVFASFLVIAFFCTYHLKQSINGWKKWFVFVGMVLMGTTTILTYSRGTLLAFIAAFAVYIVWKRNWKQIIQIVTPFVLSIVVLIALVNPITSALDIHSNIKPSKELAEKQEYITKSKNAQQSRLLNTFSPDTLGKSKSDGRLWLVGRGFAIYKDYPIIGSGFATFGDSASLSYPSPIYEKYQIGFDVYSDNQYIQIIAQTGTLGVLAFAAFLLLIFASLIKYRKEPLGTFTMLLFLAIVFSGLVYNTWEDKAVTFYFFSLLGIFLPSKFFKKDKPDVH